MPVVFVIFLILLYLLLRIYMQIINKIYEIVTGCLDRFFGDECSRECHCQSACDDVTGRCDRCETGWQLPTCERTFLSLNLVAIKLFYTKNICVHFKILRYYLYQLNVHIGEVCMSFIFTIILSTTGWIHA